MRPFALGALAVSNVLLSFAFQWHVFTRLGAGRATDALFAAAAVPQLVTAVVSGALGHVLVPLLSVEDPEGRRRLSWSLLQLAGLCFGAAVAVLAATAGLWARWLVPGFAAEHADLAVTLTRINLLGVLGGALAGVVWAALYARGEFVAAEAAPAIATAASLAVVGWAVARHGAVGVAWAGLLRPAVHLALNLPALGRYSAADPRLPGVREAWRRFRPLLGANLYTKADVLADRVLASFAAPGLLALYGFAQQGYGLGHTVLNRAIVAPAMPALAQAAATGRWPEFSALARRLAAWMLGLAALAALGLALAGKPVLLAALARGAFEGADAEALWLLLLALGGVWLGGAVGQVTSGAFYATGDTRTPARVAVVSFTIALAAKVAAFALAGLWGVAVVASAYYVANALVIGGLLRRRIAGRTGGASA